MPQGCQLKTILIAEMSHTVNILPKAYSDITIRTVKILLKQHQNSINC